jgi:peptide deformylase
MILPIVAYGDPVLRKECKEVSEAYPSLDVLLENMYETMYAASGVGLAAPQIGLPIRIFLVDASPFADEDEMDATELTAVQGFKKTFINATIIEEEGEELSFNEGCLSIPDVREDVYRKPNITVTYYDEKFTKHTEKHTGIIARIIQHEYDHIEGILFTDKLSSLKKRLIKGKLANISKGKANADYRMRFPNAKKKR